MSDFDISYNLNYGSMARGKQQVDPWVQPSLMYTSVYLELTNFIFSNTGVLLGKSQNAVLLRYSINFLCTVSKLKPKQYKLS